MLSILPEQPLKQPWRFYLLLSFLINIDFLMGTFRPVPLHDVFDGWYIGLKTNFQNLMASSGLIQWDPVSLSGNHGLVTGFHPYHILSLSSGCMPLWAVYSLGNFFMVFISGYGMHLYLSRILRHSQVSSYGASLLFLIISISFFQSEVFNFAFPLFLYSFYQCFESNISNRWKYPGVIFLIILCSFSPQTIPFFPFFHFVLILSFSRPKIKLFQHLMGFFLIWMAYFFIHAPVIYSLISEAPFSHRLASGKHFQYSFFITALKEFAGIMRSSGGGAGCSMLLASFSLFYRPFQKVAVWWACLSFSFFMVVFFNSSSSYMILEIMGFLKGFSWQRFFIYSDFIFCVLGSYGISLLEKIVQQEKEGSRKFLKVVFPLLTLFFIVVMLIDFVHSTWMHTAGREIRIMFYSYLLIVFFLFLIFYVLFKSFFKKYMMAGIGIFFAGLLLFAKFEHLSLFANNSFNFYFNSDNLKTLSIEQKKTSDLYRSVFYHDGGLVYSDAILISYSLQTATDYEVMYPLRYKKLWLRTLKPNSDDEYKRGQRWQKDFWNWGNRVYLPPNIDLINLDLVSLLNVKFMIANEANIHHPYLRIFLEKKNSHSSNEMARFPYVNFRNYFRAPLDFNIYELITAMPRTYVISNWEMVDEEEILLNRIAQKKAHEHLSSAVFLRSDIKDIILPPQTKNLKAEAEIIEYKPNRIRIRGFSSQEGVLILLDSYHRNWRVKVNHKEAEIFPANYVFRGVKVPKGTFTVEMIYDDIKLKIAYASMGFGIILLILFMKLDLLFEKKT